MVEDHDGLSRRTLLTGVGAGVGLVWVTPAVIRVDAAGASASQEPEDPEPGPESELEPEPAVQPDVRHPVEGARVRAESGESSEVQAGAEGYGDRSHRVDVLGGSLARTGSDAILPLAEGGAALLGAGAMLSLAARRRRRRTATWRLLRRGARLRRMLGSEPGAPGSGPTG